MERFNGLYLSKLENRLLASATSLAHIDRLAIEFFNLGSINPSIEIVNWLEYSNVKNLQERAHVWDTFQLHVSAWNEQIKSVDKKLDILSRSVMWDETRLSIISHWFDLTEGRKSGK